jgi:hypothetical protein
MKLYRTVDSQRRIILPNDVLEQLGFTDGHIPDKMAIDIAIYKGQKVIVLSVPNEDDSNTKQTLKG